MRQRLDKGIYKDAYGIEVRATANLITRSTRFPVGTPLRTMKQWQEDTRAAIRRDRPKPSKGTLAADAAVYLERVKDMPSIRDRRLHIAWWVERFGHRRRDSLKPHELEQALATIKSSASHYNHVRTALGHLYATLDGRSAYNPVRAVERRNAPETAPRAMPVEHLNAILGALPRPYSASSARLLVLAHTGLPHAVFSNLRPEDVDFVAGTVTVKPRRKGAGVSGQMLPLSEAGIEAFKVFASTNAWGRFSTSSLRVAFCRAAAKAGLPQYTRPYDLRHTFLTRVLVASGGNKEAVRGLALHASATTTDRYTRAAVPGFMRSSVDAVNGMVH